MPKVINQLKETILTATKAIIAKEGIDNLTIKKVADSSKIAVGTIYNYYKGKKELLSALLIEDWLIIYKDIEEKCFEVDDILTSFEIINDGIATFIIKYENLFFSNTSYDSKSSYLEQQNTLRGQVIVLLQNTNERLNTKIEDFYIPFIADSIINNSMRLLPFDNTKIILKKLIS